MNAITKKFQHIPMHHVLLFTTLLLLSMGLVMVASASIPFAEQSPSKPYYFYVLRQGIYAILGMVAALIMSKIPIRIWFKNSVPLMLWLIGVMLLIATLFFPMTNGSSRWIVMGSIKFQTSELLKLIMVIFTADYVIRRSDEVRFEWMGFLRLCIPMVFVLVFIMLQPDLGASIVIVGSIMTIFFLAGAPLRQFFLMLLVAVGAVVAAVLLAPWRMRRVQVLANPWSDQWGDGFQLTRSLMAIGRGDWTGVGLGQSVFKLAHLPEAHTDFIAAIVGEELGFLGLSLLIFLEGLLVFCTIYIGQAALKKQKMRAGYLAYGIACIFIIQIIVNIGMNLGLLPTKGLTLPLISYGGSSLLVVLTMIGMLYRIHEETLGLTDLSKRYY